MEIAKIQELPHRLKLYCPDLMSEEALIKTWLGKRMKDYEPAGFASNLKKSLAEIVLLTGSRMFDESTKMYGLQLQVISKFLLSTFPFLTFEEFRTAFYMNTQGKFEKVHSHYGRELNAEYLGTVLSDYIAYKKVLEENYGPQLRMVLAPPKVEKSEPLTDEQYLNGYREDIENAYQRFLYELEMDELLFPDYFYETLVLDGYIPGNAYTHKIYEAKNMLANKKHIDILKNPEQEKSIGRELRQMRMMKDNTVELLAKQIVVKYFFLDQMDKDIMNLYKEVEK